MSDMVSIRRVKNGFILSEAAGDRFATPESEQVALSAAELAGLVERWATPAILVQPVITDMRPGAFNKVA